MVPTESVARVLGIRSGVNSLTDLRRLIGRGLPKSTLAHVVDYVAQDTHEAAELRNRLVPPATYKRRTTLNPEEGGRLERIARVVALAEAAFGSRRDAL